MHSKRPKVKKLYGKLEMYSKALKQKPEYGTHSVFNKSYIWIYSGELGQLG